MKVVDSPNYHLTAYHISDILSHPALLAHTQRLSLGPEAGLQSFLRRATCQSKAVGVFACLKQQPLAWALCLKEVDHSGRFSPADHPEDTIAVQVYVDHPYRQKGVATSLLLAVAPWTSKLCVYNLSLRDSLVRRGINAHYT